MWPISLHACLCWGIRIDAGYFPWSVCVLIEAISWRVHGCVCVLSEECQAGNAPPGKNDVMGDRFLFGESQTDLAL